MKWTLWSALLVPTLVFAGPPAAAQDGGGKKEWGEHKEWKEKSPEEWMKMARTAKVVALASKLDLDTSTALKLDEQKKPLRMQLMENGKTIMRAAHGDEAAQKDLDGAIKKTLDARDRLASLDKDFYWNVSRGLSPQKRAQMALMLAHFEMKGRARWMKHMRHMHEKGGEHAQLEGQGHDAQAGLSMENDDDEDFDGAED